MNWLKCCSTTLLLLTLSLPFLSAQAEPILSIETQADATIQQLYAQHPGLQKKMLPQKIQWISQQFLGKPYALGALGEGTQGRYDQMPLYRVDAFDCLTYVETVLALAFSKNLPEFQTTMRQIRYAQGQVSFLTRNHFTSLDWNPNNQKQGFLKDITSTFHDEHGKSVMQLAQGVIDKAAWYQHLSPGAIRLITPDPATETQRLAELKQKGKQFKPTQATIPYLPLTTLFDAQGAPNQALFAQIPHGAIIQIVRPNWGLREKIGTILHVSHLGFAIRTGDQLFFRDASSIKQEVTDTPLVDYLRSTLSSTTIKGINVQVALP